MEVKEGVYKDIPILIVDDGQPYPLQMNLLQAKLAIKNIKPIKLFVEKYGHS